ncbi:NAD(P)(+)-binding domain-containing protein (plasmid) [Rhizobium etli 8C-3]|uniref:NAD(P)(+)-binding domain-containing protein n=2 Tax=Rhizobium etli TaxID=29449 RepID=A0A1L5PAL5_RHIET|nr:NAD(P)(+)-binding domain-containing protein [Rhizobium etli 8C-3]
MFFGASRRAGVGMPYEASLVGRENLANIACEEVPDLLVPPHEWLRRQSDNWLLKHGADRRLIGPAFIPTRHLLGKYLEGQFKSLLHSAKKIGMAITCARDTLVTDLATVGDGVNVVYRKAGSQQHDMLYFDYAVMATGHSFPAHNSSAGLARSARILSSPWPVGNLENTGARRVGLIGSSLSAVDACLTMARNSGTFRRDFDGRLNYVPNSDAAALKIVMHSRRGMLPPVRYHFEFPRFEMHSYVGEPEIRTHMAENRGFLSLDYIFENVLKAVLKAKSPEFLEKIESMNLEKFVAFIEDRRRVDKPFDLLREDYLNSIASSRESFPIFWREILDDVTYTLNFYTRYLNRTDRIRLEKSFMPLVTYLVAVLPQQSCEYLLALHAAGHLDLVRTGDDLNIEVTGGVASILFSDPADCGIKRLPYDLIIDCRGQKPIDVSNFPFRTLVNEGAVRQARLGTNTPNDKADELMLSGIDVDERLRPRSEKGMPTPGLYMLASPVIHGLYPYHSGLPFCNEVARIAADDLHAEALARSGRSTAARIDLSGVTGRARRQSTSKYEEVLSHGDA